MLGHFQHVGRGHPRFHASPDGLIADVNMLNFFRHVGKTGLIVLGILLLPLFLSRTSGAASFVLMAHSSG
jgi:hypothetical protein